MLQAPELQTFKFTVMLEYRTGHQFIIHDIHIKLYGLLRYKKTRLFGTRFTHVHMTTNYPTSLNDEGTDLYTRFNQAKHPQGKLTLGPLSNKHKAEELIGIIPSGSVDDFTRQREQWEKDHGWK